MAPKKNQMSVEELQEKVIQLEKYKLAEAKEKKKEEALRAKQGKAVRKTLVAEKQKTKIAERKREREVETLTKTVAKLEESEHQQTQQIIKSDEKDKVLVERARQGHSEKYNALQGKVLEAGSAKGKLSHLQFAVKSLETNLVLPVEFSKSKQQQDTNMFSNQELTVALQEEVEQLEEEGNALEDENKRLREELEEVRRIIDAPDETEEESEEDDQEPSDDDSLGDDGDGDTSASAVGHGAGASMPTVSPRTAPSTQACGSPVARDDPERGCAGGVLALGLAGGRPLHAANSATAAAGAGYAGRSSWPLQGAERTPPCQPSRMTTPGSVRGAMVGLPGVPPMTRVRQEPIAGQQVVQHVTVDALRQFQRLQGETWVPGAM